ncbi:hypothetical protein SCHPADRAFT_612811 [Schizopora paradoxa]|uniref:Uncharacterized protein n=1 Tax=Schizopora paradoxa TaxID=27342 RepID=A0A0H2R8X0_9AGAM|nr:hypothetical protein SCHPADRAFT_612811 [Schizopora paradoxa]
MKFKFKLKGFESSLSIQVIQVTKSRLNSGLKLNSELLVVLVHASHLDGESFKGLLNEAPNIFLANSRGILWPSFEHEEKAASTGCKDMIFRTRTSFPSLRNSDYLRICLVRVSMSVNPFPWLTRSTTIVSLNERGLIYEMMLDRLSNSASSRFRK